MATTADFLPVEDVRDNVAILKNGDIALILETSAVNFGLLSANEQLAIISSFAGLLNSLNFSIQIVIRSKRLDISDYLKVLDSAYQRQTNPLLANMMIRYRKFIETTVRENEVLDKQFFVVVSISYYEMGLTKSKEPDLKAAMSLLLPRRDHIMRQLARIGLKSNQLNTVQITQLLYDIYNFDPNAPVDNFSSSENAMNLVKQAQKNQPTEVPAEAASTNSAPQAPTQAANPAPIPDQNIGGSIPTTAAEIAAETANQPVVTKPNAPTPLPPLSQPPGRVNLPFVAEELKEEI